MSGGIFNHVAFHTPFVPLRDVLGTKLASRLEEGVGEQQCPIRVRRVRWCWRIGERIQPVVITESASAIRNHIQLVPDLMFELNLLL